MRFPCDGISGALQVRLNRRGLKRGAREGRNGLGTRREGRRVRGEREGGEGEGEGEM